MARIGLIALYDRCSIGLGSLRAFLTSRGHQVSTVYFKRYEARRVHAINGYRQGDHHVMVLNSGNDAVVCHAQPPTPDEDAHLYRALRGLELDLIGISFRSVVRDVVFRTTASLRESLGIPIIYGGISPTIEPEACILQNEMICRGEGEHALAEVAEALDRGSPPKGIRNIWFRQGGRVERNPLRPLIQDLDALPAPDYAPENAYVVDAQGVKRGGGMAQYNGLYEIMSSRGCPFACSFCCNGQLRKVLSGNGGKYVRRRSPGNVLEELIEAKRRYGIGYVNFQDDVFTFNGEWLQAFCDGYRKHVVLPFWCYAHPLCTDEASLRTIRDAGLDHLTIGVQSGSQRILREVYNRKTSAEEILRSCRLLKRLGISYDIDIITNNPLERETDCRQTLDLLLQMPAPVRFNGGLSKLAVYPATRIRQLIEERASGDRLGEETFTFYNILYLLCQTRLPRRWILAFRDSKWLRKHPSVLKLFLLRPWLKTDLPMNLRDVLPAPAVRLLRGTMRRWRRKRQ